MYTFFHRSVNAFVTESMILCFVIGFFDSNENNENTFFCNGDVYLDN